MNALTAAHRGTIWAAIALSIFAVGGYGQNAGLSGGTALAVKARGAKTFYVDTVAGRNQISIFSESTLEDFTIVCNEVGGEWQFDPQNVEQIKGKFWIRVEDMRTGIDLRDQHLRKPEWLDAAKYPVITITVDRAEDAKRVAANTASFALVGKCNLHGVTRDVRIPASLTYLDESPKTMERVKGDLIRIRGDFQLKLADYQVTGPPGSDTVGLKVAEAVAIKVSVFGSTQKPPARLKVDRPTAATQPANAATRPAAPGPGLPILQPPTRPAPAQ